MEKGSGSGSGTGGSNGDGVAAQQAAVPKRTRSSLLAADSAQQTRARARAGAGAADSTPMMEKADSTPMMEKGSGSASGDLKRKRSSIRAEGGTEDLMMPKRTRSSSRTGGHGVAADQGGSEGISGIENLANQWGVRVDEILTFLEEKRKDEILTFLEEKRKGQKPGRDKLGHVPLDLANYRVWKEYQYKGSGPQFLCYRPAQAKPPIPLTLLHESFMKFHMDVNGPLEKRDLEFACTLCRMLSHRDWIEHHESKMDEINEAFTGYFEHMVNRLPLENKIEADGVLIQGLRCVLVIEYKAEMGKSGEPLFQGLEYFRRICEKYSRLRPREQQYGLLISIVGPHLQVCGVFLDHQQKEKGKVLCEPLTDFINCYGPADSMKSTAQVLRAIRLFVESYTTDTASSVPWKLKGRHPVNRLSIEHLVFTYSDGGKQIAAKFVREYGADAHKVWNNAKVAPQFIKEEDVGNGWKLIHTDYLSSADGWEKLEEVIRDNKENAGLMSSCLMEAVNKGHAKGYVHGDLRLCNIFVRRKADGVDYEVMVVDFDWSGEEGKVRYPQLLNTEINWPPGADYGELITREHDIWFAGRLLQQLEQLEQP